MAEPHNRSVMGPLVVVREAAWWPLTRSILLLCEPEIYCNFIKLLMFSGLFVATVIVPWLIHWFKVSSNFLFFLTFHLFDFSFTSSEIYLKIFSNHSIKSIGRQRKTEGAIIFLISKSIFSDSFLTYIVHVWVNIFLIPEDNDYSFLNYFPAFYVIYFLFVCVY